MATRKVRDFADLYGSNASHEGAKSLQELKGQTFLVQDFDFGRSQYGKVTFVHVGDAPDAAQWYYTTSKVILSQITELQDKNPCPFKATLVERNNYLLFE